MPEQRNQSGLTIVELLVGMVILGIVVTGLYNLFRVHNLMAAKQEETTRMQQELLSVIVQMADDIRMCGYTPNGGSFGFNSTSTDATSIFVQATQTETALSMQIAQTGNNSHTDCPATSLKCSRKKKDPGIQLHAISMD